jgi:hypothetical protein
MVQASQDYWLAKVRELESALVQEKAKALVLQSELDLARVRVSDSELELVKLKAKVKELELVQNLGLAQELVQAEQPQPLQLVQQELL